MAALRARLALKVLSHPRNALMSSQMPTLRHNSIFSKLFGGEKKDKPASQDGQDQTQPETTATTAAASADSPVDDDAEYYDLDTMADLTFK
jgi:hypothetical protein